MTHRNGGHSTTTVSAAVHRDGEKGRQFMYQNNAEKSISFNKKDICDKFVVERVATKFT